MITTLMSGLFSWGEREIEKKHHRKKSNTRLKTDEYSLLEVKELVFQLDFHSNKTSRDVYNFVEIVYTTGCCLGVIPAYLACPQLIPTLPRFEENIHHFKTT